MTPHWFNVLLIFNAVIGFAVWISAIRSWFMALGPLRSMTANRTSAATIWYVYLNPIWFLEDDLLTEEGRRQRTKAVFWIKRFYIGMAAFGILVGGTLLTGFLVSRPN